MAKTKQLELDFPHPLGDNEFLLMEHCELCQKPPQWSCDDCGGEFCDRHLETHLCDMALTIAGAKCNGA